MVTPLETNAITRRLVAIVVADVVGYTRLMERDEAGTRARHHRPHVALDALMHRTLEGALQEYFAAVAQPQELHASGAEVLPRVLKQARKLLTVLDDELEANGDMPEDTRNALRQLRAELVELQSCSATRH